MKKIYFLIVMLFPLLLTAQNNSEYFYYYKGKKQYLELNTDYLFISSSVNRLPNKYLNYFSRSSELKRENAWDKIQQDRSFEQSYWGEIKLTKRLSKQDYFRFKITLENNYLCKLFCINEKQVYKKYAYFDKENKRDFASFQPRYRG